MAGVAGFYRGVRRSLAAAALLLALDVGYFGSFLLATIFCPTWILVSALKNAIQRPGWGIALVRIGIPALTFWLVRLNNDFQLSIARENAERVVAATEQYRAAHGKFPQKLDQLVPRFLPSVPVAKYCLGPGGRFYYYENSQTPMLVWQVVTPYFRRIYNFETRTWSELE